MPTASPSVATLHAVVQILLPARALSISKVHGGAAGEDGGLGAVLALPGRMIARKSSIWFGTTAATNDQGAARPNYLIDRRAVLSERGLCIGDIILPSFRSFLLRQNLRYASLSRSARPGNVANG